MNITIANLDRDAATGGVQTAHWIATDSDGTHTASIYGTVGFTPDPTDPNFVAFEDLTPEIVIAWVEDALGEEQLIAMQTSLDTQLASLANPPVLSGTPW